MSGGKRAGKSGVGLEDHVARILEGFGYSEQSSQDFDLLRDRGDKLFSRQYQTGENIYRKRRRVDFILFNREKWPHCLVIQCKWQASTGTVDEKYPFEVLCIEKDGYPAIIVLDGEGYHDGAKSWLQEQIGSGKLEAVLSTAEFQRYARKHL